MSSEIEIGDTVRFDVVTHTTAGAISDADSAPTFSVFEDATDTPIVGPTSMTKRTSLTGNYRGSFVASAANGFETGKWYSVIATGIVGTVTGKTVAMHFTVVPTGGSEGAGSGTVLVDHDYGGTDELRYETSGGVGIDNAEISVYLTSDYDAGNRGASYVVARSRTDVNGRWTRQVALDPEDYTIVFYAQGRYGPDTMEVTVS